MRHPQTSLIFWLLLLILAGAEEEDPENANEENSVQVDKSAIQTGQTDSEDGQTDAEPGQTGQDSQRGRDEEQRLPRTRVVRTKYGQVQGRIHQLKSDQLNRLGLNLAPVEVYQGIRFATPPVGANRWQPTRAPSPWKGILQAASPGPVCPQRFPDISNETEALRRMPRARMRSLQFLRPHLLRQSEDCLYLNIFVPRQREPEYVCRHSSCTYGHADCNGKRIAFGIESA